MLRPPDSLQSPATRCRGVSAEIATALAEGEAILGAGLQPAARGALPGQRSAVPSRPSALGALLLPVPRQRR